MGLFGSKKAQSGFDSSSTAEEVTKGIDGTGLTAIVTGATSGIGTETARVLALRGVHVVMAVRNTNTGAKVKEAILTEFPSARVDVKELDLGSLASVRKFASEYNSSGLPLNLLVNNAGIMGPPFTLSKDNIELQFATNYLGPFLLTTLLLEKIKNTARESHKEGRIVIVGSEAHRLADKDGIRFDKINDKSIYNGFTAYGQSKLGNTLHANELARRLKEEGVDVTVNSLHPGNVATDIMRHNKLMNVLSKVIGKLFLKNVQQGAATTCYVALHPEVKGVSGEYFSDCKVAKASDRANDPELAKKLWDFGLGMTEPK